MNVEALGSTAASRCRRRGWAPKPAGCPSPQPAATPAQGKHTYTHGARLRGSGGGEREGNGIVGWGETLLKAQVRIEREELCHGPFSELHQSSRLSLAASFSSPSSSISPGSSTSLPQGRHGVAIFGGWLGDVRECRYGELLWRVLAVG